MGVVTSIESALDTVDKKATWHTGLVVDIQGRGIYVVTDITPRGGSARPSDLTYTYTRDRVESPGEAPYVISMRRVVSGGGGKTIPAATKSQQEKFDLKSEISTSDMRITPLDFTKPSRYVVEKPPRGARGARR